MRPRIREAILVEGRYDRNTLSQVVEASILESGGFEILRDREKLQFLRLVAEKQGLVIFTDSDGAGFLIRNRLKSMLPPERLLQAYIPEVPGKEKRKRQGGRAGLLGVEGMTPAVLLEALRRSGAHFLSEDQPRPYGGITRQDLFALGLTGGQNSAARRDRVKLALSLPRNLGTGAFLEALNLVTDLETLTLLAGEAQKTDTGIRKAGV